MNTQEAKRGFLTFLSTILVASGIFFSAYVAVNKLNSKTALQEEPSVQGVTDQTSAENGDVQEEEKPSVFAALAGNDSGDSKNDAGDDKMAPVVLAGADEATGSSVPVTGSNTLWMTMILGLGISILSIILSSKKMRTVAIRSFEKDITRD